MWPCSEKLPEGMKHWMVTITYDNGNKSLIGSMMKRQMSNMVSNFIDVKSIDEYSSKLEQLGDKIVVSKTALPGMRYFAIALIQKKMTLQYGN